MYVKKILPVFHYMRFIPQRFQGTKKFLKRLQYSRFLKQTTVSKKGDSLERKHGPRN